MIEIGAVLADCAPPIPPGMPPVMENTTKLTAIITNNFFMRPSKCGVRH
jgi:hypothetical protein